MRDHRSLHGWQRAHVVVHGVLDLCRDCWKPHAAAVFEQLQRSSLSVQLNIAEGYALRSPARLKNHLTIAYGSVVETIDLLELLSERELGPAEAISTLIENAVRTRGILLGLLRKYR